MPQASADNGMQPPDWWFTRPDEIQDSLASLPGVDLQKIGQTGAGRLIIAAAWGKHEALPNQTSTSLAIYRTIGT